MTMRVFKERKKKKQPCTGPKDPYMSKPNYPDKGHCFHTCSLSGRFKALQICFSAECVDNMPPVNASCLVAFLMALFPL